MIIMRVALVAVLLAPFEVSNAEYTNVTIILSGLFLNQIYCARFISLESNQIDLTRYLFMQPAFFKTAVS